MDLICLDAEVRGVSGKGALKRLKSEGIVPGILYDESGNIPISIDEHELNLFLCKHGKDSILNLKLEGKDIEVTVREIQKAPVSQDILHIDLIPIGKGILH